MKYILRITCVTFLLGVFSYGMSLNAQSDIKFFIEDLTADAGSTVEYDVTVEEFQQVASIQFSVVWDSLILEYDSVINVNPEIMSGAFNSPQKGILNVLWVDISDLANVDNGDVLFTIVFNVIGNECDEGDIQIPQMPESPARDIELYKFIGGNEAQVDGIPDNGSILVNGEECGGGGNVTFRASHETVDQGQEVCVSFEIENFEDVITAQFVVEYDSSLLSYTEATNFNLPAMSNSNFNDLGGGKLVFSWNGTGSPITRPDGTVAFELCFDAVGPNGTVSDINMIDDPPREKEVVIRDNGEDVVIVPTTINGSVTIGENMFNGLEIILEDQFISSNGSFCVPVIVNGFEEITLFGFEVNFNSNLLEFDTIRNINLDFLGSSDFNTNNSDMGELRVFWDDPTLEGVTTSDGTTIFELCFTVKGECSPTDIVNNPDFDGFEAIDVDGEIPIVVRAAELQCGFSVGGDVTNESCGDACDGEIDLEITPDDPSFEVTWSGPTNIADGERNPTDLCDGTYEVTVTDPNSSFTIETSFDIESPNEFILATADIEPEITGNDGSIDITVTGKTNSLEYTWDTDPPSTTQDISNLSAGNYSLTIEDSETGCQILATFMVPLEFTLSVDKTDIECNGDGDGAIDLTINGGSGDFSYEWSCTDETTQDLEDLSGGDCTVTITDVSNNFQIVQTITINEPAPITIDSDITEDDGTGSGAIDITPSGGSGDYEYEWSTGDNTQDISNLEVGIYYVTITDENGCSYAFGPLVVTDGSLLVVTQTSKEEFNGSGVSCNGACDGFIIVQSYGGEQPYDIEWEDGITDTARSNLCPGTYSYTVTDAENVTFNESIDLTEPGELSVSNLVTNCATDNDGSVDVSIQGGTESYMYSWDGINFDTISAKDDLSVGSYTAFVRDANGCELMFNYEIRDCTEGDCYEGRPAITPNDDGRNDQLIIRCANERDNTLQIFDKFGRLVYEEDNYQNTWEGTHMNGNAVNEGTYIWVLKVEFNNGNKEIYKGTVSVLRNLR